MFFRKPAPDVKPEEEPPENKFPLSSLRDKIDKTALPAHASDAAIREFEKLQKTDPAVAEYTVGLNYIELLLDLPWQEHSQCNFDLIRAQKILDSRHCGLKQVKQRILEFLAAKTLRGSVQPHILIVDDEEIARENMAHALNKAKYHCETAANGIEAVNILNNCDIDLVITDLKMDGMDGIELLEHINRQCHETQVIMVTGFATVNSAVEALKKGAAHYLGKPVNLEELKRTVDEVLTKKLTVEMGRGPILCFSGPPGTGKTSVGQAIAESLHRHFVRVSVAGLRDEAELRGHRRTYVGAMPGRILTELRRTGVSNPVFMLDEIDKIGQDFRGDPASVLLEILDPEQNSKFVDHYLDIPFDLSNIMFMATANDLSKLPGPLLDRMELIQFTGYTEHEKLRISKHFIIPRQLKAAGLNRENVTFSDNAISNIINNYTRESGLRNLEREIANVCRKIALLKLNAEKSQEISSIDQDTITSFLGPKTFFREVAEEEDRVGITTGLVWSETGGEIISIETAKMQGNGALIMTGSLGEILQESAQTALSLIRSKADEFGVPADFFPKWDIHIHIPAGSVSKDGPSAGITIFAALLSLLTERPAKRSVASTGEMTLSGKILPISGIREKLLAAQRAGITLVLVPEANRDEVMSLPQDMYSGLEVMMVKNAEEMIEKVLT
ncbi:endopeptidase La [Desulfopila sp. IMCC35008]|uniref:endopeptidase La n=1 Tax=Desulfopila sp. IMCC35008 TaxID=2653858 RepID=UPI0013D517A5|nr:endopeptidase La [Desulfopila sp. IMCC35008]